MPENNPKKQTGREPAPVNSRVQRPLAQIRQDDGYPKLCHLFFVWSEDSSPDHVSKNISVLQRHFKKTFEEAIVMLSAAHSGQTVYVGDYTPEVLESKVWEMDKELSALGYPLMMLIPIPKTL